MLAGWLAGCCQEEYIIAKFSLLLPDVKSWGTFPSSATDFHKTSRNLIIFKSFTLSNVAAVGQWFEKVQRETWQSYGSDFSYSVRKQAKIQSSPAVLKTDIL